MPTLNIAKIHCHCRRELQKPRVAIDCCNWADDFPYAPSVNFSAAHDSQALYLRFRVTERYLAAMVDHDGGKVWTDSCVEFFISFDDTGYYNFEFSCIGRMLLAFRVDRPTPTPAPDEILALIDRESTLGDQCFEQREAKNSDDGNWELNVRIPCQAFFKHNFTCLDGVRARGNFYKCGDGLKLAHFLSWAPINTAQPNFHVPNCFGSLIFE